MSGFWPKTVVHSELECSRSRHIFGASQPASSHITALVRMRDYRVCGYNAYVWGESSMNRQNGVYYCSCVSVTFGSFSRSVAFILQRVVFLRAHFRRDSIN